jgi:hypothetical protein
LSNAFSYPYISYALDGLVWTRAKHRSDIHLTIRTEFAELNFPTEAAIAVKFGRKANVTAACFREKMVEARAKREILKPLNVIFVAVRPDLPKPDKVLFALSKNLDRLIDLAEQIFAAGHVLIGHFAEIEDAESADDLVDDCLRFFLELNFCNS